MAAERGTSDKMEATRFSQCAHDQRRRLEAEDCDSIRCAQLISSGRRRIHPPYCLAHARPTMCCIRLVIITYMCMTLRHRKQIYFRGLTLIRKDKPRYLLGSSRYDEYYFILAKILGGGGGGAMFLYTYACKIILILSRLVNL